MRSGSRSVLPIVCACVAAVIALLWLALRDGSARDAAAGDRVERDAEAEHEGDSAAQLEVAAEELAGNVRRPAQARPRPVAASGVAGNGAPFVGDVRVTLVDARGRPLAGISGRVELRSGRNANDFDELASRLTDGSSANGPRTDARDEFAPRVAAIPHEGAVAFDALPFGTYTVTAEIDGFRPALAEVRVRNSEPHGAVTLAPKPCRVFDVSLRTPDGGSFIAALRKLEPSAEKLLRPQLDEHEPDLRGSGFVPFCTSRRESTDDAYWQTFAANTHASLTLTLFLNEVPIASERAIAGLAQMQVVVPLETVIDVISARQSITGFNEPK